MAFRPLIPTNISMIRLTLLRKVSNFTFVISGLLVLLLNGNSKGDAPWKCFKTSLNELVDNMVDDTALNWKKQEYDIWYHDPEVIAHIMLVNTDFNNEFDVAPYVQLDKTGERQRLDFMSGDFPWCQCVCQCLFCFLYH